MDLINFTSQKQEEIPVEFGISHLSTGYLENISILLDALQVCSYINKFDLHVMKLKT